MTSSDPHDSPPRGRLEQRNRHATVTRLLKVSELPTLPQVVAHILEVTGDDRSSARDLIDVLENDHAISARVLRLANSAYFGLPGKVSSIKRAVINIGFDAVRSLSLATGAMGVLSEKQQFALDPEEFWLHAFGAAKAAQVLCERQPVEKPEAVFTVALLHDIGKYLFAIVLENEYLETVVTAEGAKCNLQEVEQERLGMDHAEAGAFILRQWRFPEIFSEVISNLYGVNLYCGAYARELAIVSLANSVSRRAGFGNAGDWAPPTASLWARDVLRLNNEAVNQLVSRVEQHRDSAAHLLETPDTFSQGEGDIL